MRQVFDELAARRCGADQRVDAVEGATGESIRIVRSQDGRSGRSLRSTSATRRVTSDTGDRFSSTVNEPDDCLSDVRMGLVALSTGLCGLLKHAAPVGRHHPPELSTGEEQAGLNRPHSARVRRRAHAEPLDSVGGMLERRG